MKLILRGESEKKPACLKKKKVVGHSGEKIFLAHERKSYPHRLVPASRGGTLGDSGGETESTELGEQYSSRPKFSSHPLRRHREVGDANLVFQMRKES